MSAAITAAVIVAAGAAGAAAITADSNRKAANQQADALEEARRSSMTAAERARLDVLDRMDPALVNYGRELQQIESGLKDGSADIMQVLQNATGRANQILSDAGANAQQAIMGSSAAAQGVPRSEFNQQYTQFVQKAPAQQLDVGSARNAVSTLPPEERARAELELTSAMTPNARQAILDKYGVSMTPGSEVRGSNLGGTASIPGGESMQMMGRPTDQPIQMQQQPDGSYAPAAPMAPAAPGGVPQIGYTGAVAQLERGQVQGTNQLRQGYGTARQDITAGEQASLAEIARGKTESLGAYEPYAEAGTSAVQMEAALSGALGPEAQQKALDAYIESPGQQYLRERQEQSLLRSGAAIGGLGGGNIRTALQEQAMQIASTDQQQHLENLRSLAMRGQEVAGAQTGIIDAATGRAVTVQGNAASQRAQLAASLGVAEADLTRMTTSDLALLAERTGMSIAQLQQVIGGQQAMAIGDLGSQLASVQGGTLADIASLRERGAATTLSGEQNIAQFIANLGVESGTQVANFQAAQGSALAAGTAAQGNAWAQGAQGLGAAAAYGLQNYQNTPTATPSTTTVPTTAPATYQGPQTPAGSTWSPR